MVYKWYILPIGELYATYHLLGEPETTIDFRPDATRSGWTAQAASSQQTIKVEALDDDITVSRVNIAMQSDGGSGNVSKGRQIILRPQKNGGLGSGKV